MSLLALLALPNRRQRRNSETPLKPSGRSSQAPIPDERHASTAKEEAAYMKLNSRTSYHVKLRYPTQELE